MCILTHYILEIIQQPLNSIQENQLENLVVNNNMYIKFPLLSSCLASKSSNEHPHTMYVKFDIFSNM